MFPAPDQELAWRLSHPEAAAAARYGARDTAGGTLDALQVAEDPGGRGYLGVWHAHERGVFVTRVGTSADLLHWQRRADLDVHASQPALTVLPGGGVLVALEADDDNGAHLRFRRYASVAALLAARPEATYDAPRTLAATAEGTPSFTQVVGDARRVVVGFHFYREQDVDRQATGTLTGLGGGDVRWTTRVAAAADAAFTRAGVIGNLGDRDTIGFHGRAFTLQEGQLAKGDFGSWRQFLRDDATGAVVRLPVRTAHGGRAVGNGTAAVVRAPGGGTALVVTYFVFGTRDAGELIFVTRLADGAAAPVTASAIPGRTPHGPRIASALAAGPPRRVDAARLLRGGAYVVSLRLPASEVLGELWVGGRLLAARDRRVAAVGAGRIRLRLRLLPAAAAPLRAAAQDGRPLLLRVVVTTPGGTQVVHVRRVRLRR